MHALSDAPQAERFAYGTIWWTPWVDSPRVCARAQSGVVYEFAPRVYHTAIEVSYSDMTFFVASRAKLADLVWARHHCAVAALTARVYEDWTAEVPAPQEAVVFASGAGISSGATMFYNPPRARMALTAAWAGENDETDEDDSCSF